MAESEQTDTTQDPGDSAVPKTQDAAAEGVSEAPSAPEQEGEASQPAFESPSAEQQPAARGARRSAGKRQAPSPGPRSPEQRHAERLQQRRAKAIARRARRLQERGKAAARRAASPAPAELAPVHVPKRGAPKERQGIVVSDKADKTITVRIDVARQHRRYEKIVRSSATLHAHDEGNEAREGDLVRVIESKPISRTKRWRLLDVLERAQ